MEDMAGMGGDPGHHPAAGIGGSFAATPTPGMAAMHMTFFWGDTVEVLFSGFPGTRGPGAYLLSLLLVLLLAFLAEALSSASRRVSSSSRASVSAGLSQTALHGARIGLLYLVMLAVMSFNGGVFLAAVAGHALGFFLFGSSALGWGGSAADRRRGGLISTDK